MSPSYWLLLFVKIKSKKNVTSVTTVGNGFIVIISVDATFSVNWFFVYYTWWAWASLLMKNFNQLFIILSNESGILLSAARKVIHINSSIFIITLNITILQLFEHFQRDLYTDDIRHLRKLKFAFTLIVIVEMFRCHHRNMIKIHMQVSCG